MEKKLKNLNEFSDSDKELLESVLKNIKKITEENPDNEIIKSLLKKLEILFIFFKLNNKNINKINS